NIIVCGQAGVGKSSLINMLDGGRKEVAKTSNDIVGCTFKSEPYNVTAPSGRKFTLWDTAGLDEGPTGRVKASAAISNIRELTRQLAAPTGLSLIICVVRGKILSSTQKNYLLFKAFCDSKVPFVLVVTGLDDVSNRAMWWEQNESYFHRADLFSDGHACIVSSERRRTEKAYVESVKEVFDLIERTCPRDPWKADNKSWFIQTVVNVVGVLVAS
ncbi:P-loop containing nucleoside triphosphate hydrolase protein, partial [Athelia psychrophila]